MLKIKKWLTKMFAPYQRPVVTNWRFHLLDQHTRYLMGAADAQELEARMRSLQRATPAHCFPFFFIS
jgi:hypothetical protein